jgi:hypothetical protein
VRPRKADRVADADVGAEADVGVMTLDPSDTLSARAVDDVDEPHTERAPVDEIAITTIFSPGTASPGQWRHGSSVIIE